MGREKLEALLMRPYLAVAVALVITAIGVLSGFPFSEERLNALTKEDGWIEVATVVVYGVALLSLLSCCRFEPAFFAQSAFVVGLLAARELDLHKAFTTDSVLTTRFFFRDHVPVPEKVIAGLVVVALLIVVLHYLRNWRRLRDGLKARTPAALSAALAILLLPAAKFLDAFGRLLRGFGIEITFNIDAVGIVEESLELAIPAVIALAAAQYALRRTSSLGR